MRGNKLMVTVHELGPGQRTAPYHFEYGNEEWAIVLEGRPTLRDPDGERLLDPGDVVCFPRGAAGAHELRNAGTGPTNPGTGPTNPGTGLPDELRNPGTATVRVLIVTTMVQPAVTVYPDDETLEVTPPGKLFAEADALTGLDGV